MTRQNETGQQKKTVIFVGAFKSAASDGTIGGQAIACQSLVDSPLSENVNWILLDSTQVSQPPPGWLVRALNAFKRVMRVLFLMLTRKVDALFVFTMLEFSSFSEKGLMLILARLLGKRTVLSIRSQVRELKSDKYVFWYRRLVLRCCSSFVCQSEHAASALINRFGCPKEKIEIVANWVDANRYSPSSKNNSLTKFMFMGWLEKFKGVQHLVEAADQLNQAGHKFKVDIYGGGRELQPLTELCSQLDLNQVVEFHGWVSGPAKLAALETANVSILPSYSEGMPNSVLEAMACGLAVISTPVGGVPALIQSQEQGILVEVGDAKGLAEAMLSLIQDPERIERMGIANREFVEKNHHIENVWPVMSRVLNSETTKLCAE